MKHTNKKAFTIVELVIVIAIIAILAAVIIAIFAGIIDKAERSKDMQLIRNMNTAVIADAQINGKHSTLYDAGMATADAGYIIDKILLDEKNIAWDSVNDRFVYIEKDGSLTYVPGETLPTKLTTVDEKVFKVYRSLSEVGEDKCSIYAGEGWTGGAAVTVSNVGFDAGNQAISSVTYKGTATTSTDGKNVVIRTNGGELKLDAAYDKVKFYGNATVIDVDHISTTSLWIYGSANMVNMSNGRLVITNDEKASVGTIFLSATNQKYDNIILATQNGAELPEIIAREAVELPDSGEKKIIAIVQDVDGEGTAQGQEEHIYLYGAQTSYEEVKGYENVSDMGTMILEAPVGTPGESFTIKVKDGAGTKDVEVKYDELPAEVKETKTGKVDEIKAAASEFGGGKGTKENPWLIYDYATMQKISNHYNDQTPHYFKVAIDKCDKDENGYAIIDCKGWDSVDLNGHFDGSGVRFVNLDAMLFGEVTNNLKNEIIQIGNFDIVNCYMTGGYMSATIEDIYWSFKLHNINVSGYIVGTGWTTPFVGYCGSANEAKTYTFENCYSNASLIGGACSGFLTHQGAAGPLCDMYIIDSKFEGTMNNDSGYFCSQDVNDGKGNAMDVHIKYSSNFDVTGLYNCKVSYVDEGNGFIHCTHTGYTGVAIQTFGNYTKEGGISSIPTAKGNNPDKLSTFSIESSGSSYAMALYMIGPDGNGIDVPGGNYTGIYMSEKLTEKDGKYTTENIKYYEVTINDTSTQKTGVTDDGKTFNIVSKAYGNTYASNAVIFVEYSSLGTVLKITTFDLK